MGSFERRDFLKFIALLAGGMALSPALTAQVARADAKTPLLDVKDPTAKAVKYVDDYKKAPQAKGNHCATCSFYKKADTRNGKEVRTCLIFAGKYVYTEAYCASWAKKS